MNRFVESGKESWQYLRHHQWCTLTANDILKSIVLKQRKVQCEKLAKEKIVAQAPKKR
jgi:hypothetical protein